MSQEEAADLVAQTRSLVSQAKAIGGPSLSCPAPLVAAIALA
jgi:hypothetical protein